MAVQVVAYHANGLMLIRQPADITQNTRHCEATTSSPKLITTVQQQVVQRTALPARIQPVVTNSAELLQVIHDNWAHAVSVQIKDGCDVHTEHFVLH